MPQQPPQYQPFPVAALPPEVANFISSSAAQVNCDPALVALPTLTLLAGYIGNSRSIRLKPGWSEPCILWTATIGKSGSLKSPAFDQPFRRLNRWIYKKNFEFCKAENKRLKFSKPFGQEPIQSWPCSVPEVENPIITEFAMDVLTRNFAYQARKDCPRGLLLARDDLSDWIGSFERHRKNARDAHKWFEMHKAGTFSVIRKVDKYTSEGATRFFHDAALSVAGTMHPETLKRAHEKQNCLLPRLLMAWPPPKPRQWTNEPEDTNAHEAFESLFERLVKLNFARDEAGFAVPVEIKLSPEAEAVWADFYNANAEEMETVNDMLSANFAKLESYCARFALLLHVISVARASGPCDHSANATLIQPETMQSAIKLTEWFKNEHRRIYSLISDQEDEDQSVALVRVIESHGHPITANELRMIRKRRYPTNAAAEEALNSLILMGVGKWQTRPSTITGGRRAKEFRLTLPGTGGITAATKEVPVVLVPPDNGSGGVSAATKEVPGVIVPPVSVPAQSTLSSVPSLPSLSVEQAVPAASAEVSEVIVPPVLASAVPPSPEPRTLNPEPCNLPVPEVIVPPVSSTSPARAPSNGQRTTDPGQTTYVNPDFEHLLPPNLIPLRRKL